MRLIFLLLTFLPALALAQSTFVYGDLLPDAPELAAAGEHAIGVRTIEIVNPEQPNLVAAEDAELKMYERKLTLEVWYPSEGDPNSKATTVYEEVMGVYGNPERPLIPFSFQGRAVRDAPPKIATQPYPLVIVSHGYVGSRYLMTYLTENLASKGYVVVAIDHADATFRDAGPFHSTLYFRSIDVLFTLDAIDALSQPRAESFLAGLVDCNQTGLVGYSMGGYGVLNVGGAGYSPQLSSFFQAQTGGSTIIDKRCVGNEAFPAQPDPRIKAIVAFAPWGQNFGVWNEEGLQGLSVPTFFIAGDQDDISGYDNGIKAIYEGATNAERYLLTYAGARHNVAPNPAPPEALAPGLHLDEYLRYADSVWDTRRMNNINQHFLTAFLGWKLRGHAELANFLELSPAASDEWAGFQPRTAVGLSFASGQP
ncbi:MAG: dienelactone hydrolase [Bacteroidota bacterium]